MVPTLDVHSIGAGGGSVAHIDSVGSLIVGPTVQEQVRAQHVMERVEKILQ